MKKNKPKILIQIGYSKKIGTGHFYRILNIINAFSKKKVQIFVCGNVNFKIDEQKKIEKSGGIYLKKVKNFSQIRKFILNYGILNFLVDDPNLSINLQKKYKQLVKNLILYQDIPKKNFCNTLINHNLINNNFLIYKKLSNKKTKHLIGFKYFFFNKKINITKKLDNNILIFFGGATNSQILNKTLKVIKKDKYNNFNFYFIIGSFSKFNFQKYKKKNIKILESLDQKIFYNFLSRAKYIICSGGTTLLESVVLNVYPFVVKTSENQKNNIFSLRKKNMISYIGNINFKIKDLTQKLDKKIFSSKEDINSNKKYFQREHKSNMLIEKIYQCLKI